MSTELLTQAINASNNQTQASKDLADAVAAKMTEIDNANNNLLATFEEKMVIDRQYRINTSAPAKLLDSQAAVLGNGGYILLMRVMNTSTPDTMQIWGLDIYMDSSNRKIVTLHQIRGPLESDGNQIQLYVDANDDAAIRLFNHSGYYNVSTKIIGC